MAAKIISQRKWAKLVASTGSLSQPPGALSRLSNLLFNQRGSLQIADGSFSIGQIPAPFTSPAFVATFTQYASGQYPIYPVLANTPGPEILDIPSASGIPSGATTNVAGTYHFAIVALGSVAGLSVNTAPFLFQFTTASSFAAVNFTWPVVQNATGYDIYYLATLGALSGNKILSNIPGTVSGLNLVATFTGALTSGSTSLPAYNTSYILQLCIGSVAPPSKIVQFAPVTGGAFSGIDPQPAQLSPGGPNFVFDTITAISQTFTAGTIGGALAITAGYGSPASGSQVIASGWGSYSVLASQTLSLPFTVSGSVYVLGFGTAHVSYDYSVDGGGTWSTFDSYTYAHSTTFTNTEVCVIAAGVLTNLNLLQIRMRATASCSTSGGETDFNLESSGSFTVSATTYSSFSPYGGISGKVCSIPMMLQFAGKEILILGNGYAPQSCDPSQLAAATLTPLANTFQNAFPDWQSSVTWLTGAQVTDGSSNYYTATQGGVSGTSAPSWNTALGAQTADGTVLWTSQGPIVASTAPRGAAHAVAYAGSLWLANTSPANTSDGIDGPSCLKMSDSNNPNSWNPVNTAFVGRQDGSQITGLCPFTIAALGISPTGSLCIFKEFTTYQFIGVFGTTSFEIQPAQTNLGCIAARSIQFLPGFGVVRFTHLGFAVFDGINDRLISEDIRPYLFGGVDSEADLVPVDPAYVYLSQSAQTVAPPMYLCAMPLSGQSGALTRLFCYDLVMKSWAVLDLPWAISSMATVAGGEGYPLVLAGKSDGTIQRLQSGDLNWDQGATDQSAVQWSFRTPDLFGEGGTQRLFYERATITGYGSAAMVQSIIANLWLDGQQIGSQAIDIVPQGGSNLFTANVSIFRNGNRAHLDISGNSGGATGVIDSVDWAVTPKSNMARRVIS
jgi:hypothetical protein